MKAAKWSVGAIALSSTFLIVAVSGNGAAASGFSAAATSIAAIGAFLSALGAALLYNRYIARHGPVIVIDADGIRDHRVAAQPIPWMFVSDLRPLDSWGFRVAVQFDAMAIPANDNTHRSSPWWRRSERDSLIIDTFFLRSRTGNRLLDLLLPMTEMAPIDFTEQSSGPQAIAEDARKSRRWCCVAALYVAFALILPTMASASLMLKLT